MANAQHELNRVLFKLLGEEKGMKKLKADFGNFRASYGGIMETNRNDNMDRDSLTNTTTDTAKKSSVSYTTAWRHMKKFLHLCHKWKNLWRSLTRSFQQQARQWSD